MAPAARDLLIKGLASALTLVAGTGMGEAERKTWFASAAITLRDLPEDLFRRGIDEARRKADHPAKIVPLVISATEDAMRRRRSDLGKVEALRDCDRRMPWEPSAESEDRPATPEEIEAIKNELGLKTEPFGTRPKLAAGKPRMPTRDDYAALGVDPSVLDMLRTDSG